MQPLLYLVHRIPFPPNKGDKIRSYNLLRFLADRYRVHLGTFVDHQDDWQYLSHLEKWCSDTCVQPLRPEWQRVRSLTALLSGEAMSLPYYRNQEMAAWVRKKLLEEGISRVVVFSSVMAQFVPANGSGIRKVVDFVDVDSEKWRQYSERRPWPMSWLYRREGERLLDFEREVAFGASASVFVTPEEANLFRLRTDGVPGSIHAIVNGVDTKYFSPNRPYANPYRGEDVIVFTGVMDYWANVDAVEWFTHECFPAVRRELSTARFVIVGARPTRTVAKLAHQPGVEVTGAVEDVRPYLAHAKLAVAPMRIARGIQNKVLEAMAMGLPVVATEAAVDGLEIPAALRANVMSDPAKMAARIVDLVTGVALASGELGREWVCAHHDWGETLRPMEALVEGVGDGAR